MQKWAAGGELLVWGAAFRPPPGSFAAFPEIAFGSPQGGSWWPSSYQRSTALPTRRWCRAGSNQQRRHSLLSLVSFANLTPNQLSANMQSWECA